MFSVLIFFYNEEGNVLLLLEEVYEVLVDFMFEVVCVNDCFLDFIVVELK